MLEPVALAILSYLLLETVLFALLRYLRRDCQWLLMKPDRTPNLDVPALDKFEKFGMDAELGWVRKPNTSGQEIGQEGQITTFSINERGARTNPDFDELPSEILVFGDSYAFCRQVNDTETWPHMVSNILNLNTLNFGVGNYGADQAIIRMKRELPKSQAKLVVLLVVPETLCRVHSVWKHYTEFGNTFGFKPRFFLKNAQLVKYDNPVNCKDAFLNYQSYLEEIQAVDFFYRTKFLKHILFFPFTFSLLRSINRSGPLVLALILAKLIPTKNNKDRPFGLVLKNNHLILMEMYKDRAAVELLAQIIKLGQKEANKFNCKFLFCMVPQLQDIKLIKKHGKYYSSVFERLGEGVEKLDLIDDLVQGNQIHKVYTNDRFGGHLSAYGNQIISKRIAEKIKVMVQKAK